MDWLNGQLPQPAPDPFMAVPPPAEIEMPPEYVGSPQIGYPHAPSPDPSLIAMPETGPDRLDASAQGNPYNAPPQEMGGTETPYDLPHEPGPLGSIPFVGDAAARTGADMRMPANDEQAYPTHTDKPISAMAVPEEYQSQGELNDTYAHKTPEQLAKAEFDLGVARHADETAKAKEASLARDRQADDDRRVYLQAKAAAQRSREQLQIDSDALAKTEITDRRSTETRILNGIAAFFGGMGRGQNQVLASIDNDLNRDADAQRAEIANRRASLGQRATNIGEQLQQAMSDDHEAAVYRDATYARLMDKIATGAQDFDPRGTQALAYGKMYQALGQQRASWQVAQDDKRFKQELDLAKAETERMGPLETQRHNLVTEGAAALKAGGAGGVGKEKPSFGTTYANLDAVPDAQKHLAFRLPTRDGVRGGWIIAGNDEARKEATAYSALYGTANDDLATLQKIAIQRDGERSASGQLSKRWLDTGERHYRSVLLDFANTYGMMIHGSSPTSTVLEEVLDTMPQLKGVLDSGHTATEIDNLRNDVDNRATVKFNAWGSNDKIATSRPHVDQPDAATTLQTLTAKPVVGDAGYASADVKNYFDTLKQHSGTYENNPGRDDAANLDADLTKVEHAQKQNYSAIRADIVNLQRKKDRTPADDAYLASAKKALEQTAEKLRAVEDARKLEVKKAKDRENKKVVKGNLTNVLDSVQDTIEEAR